MRFFHEIKSSPSVKEVIKTNMLVKSINQQNNMIKRLVKLHFKIGNFSWTFDFLVVNSLPFPIILGVNFMQKFQMTLDFSASTINFRFNTNSNLQMSDIFVKQQQPDSNFLLELSEASKIHSQKTEDFLQEIIQGYPSVITKRIGQARVAPYRISCLADKPVCLPHYPIPPES